MILLGAWLRYTYRYMEPSRRQRTGLARTLKQFAFEQSPLFQEGKIQTMEVTQSFEIIEKVPEEAYLPGVLPFDQVRIKLGFCATRFSDGPKTKPIYTYNVTTEGTQAIHPRQLDLTDEAWTALWEKYMDDEADMPDEDVMQGTVRYGDFATDDMKEDIIDCLLDAGAECELYQKSMLSFSTVEPGIESSYERGVSIEHALFDSVSTHDHLDGGWEYHQTPDGVLYVPPAYAPDELSIGDEIETRTQFTELIRAYGTDQQAAENGLLPHEDKLREMMHAVECLRSRRIDLL